MTAAVIVALFPLEMVLSTASTNSDIEDQFRRYGHPLLAPDLPDYRIESAGASPSAPVFSYRLRLMPAGTPVPDDALQTGQIQVKQQPVPPEFNPPADCDVEGISGRIEPEPCTQIAPDLWRISRDSYLVYLARRGDQIVYLRPGAAVPDSDLLKAATTLREVPPDHFIP